MPREDRAGRIVRIREVDDLGTFGDRGSDRREIVSPVVVRNSPVRDAAGFRENLKADEGRLGRQDLVVVAQECSDDVGHDRVRATADDDVIRLDLVFLCQHTPQFFAGCGIYVERAERVPNRLHCHWGSSERVLI